MFNNGGMSPADIAAMSNDNFGNGSWFWIIIFIILIFGWGNNGNGWNNGNSGALENYVLNSDFASLSRQIDSATQSLERKGDGINNGLCDGFYAMNTGLLNGFANVNTNVGATGQSVLNAINQNSIDAMQNTNNINSQITALGNQMSSCCCQERYDNATQFANMGYNLADQSCQTRRAVTDSTIAITANQDANTRSILEAIQNMQTSALQDKINTLTADNQALKFAASQQAQNSYLISRLNPTPIPSYPASNLYGYYNGCCGCNA